MNLRELKAITRDFGEQLEESLKAEHLDDELDYVLVLFEGDRDEDRPIGYSSNADPETAIEVLLDLVARLRAKR